MGTWIHRCILIFGVFLFVFLGTILPRVSMDLFMSPDETAVMLFARAWAPHAGFRLATSGSAALANIIPLHPRSMIRVDGALVPVGFLGMPFLAALAERVSHGASAYVTLLLVLSSAWPLCTLVQKFVSPRAASMATLLYLLFPTVILYVNRGLFPNLPVVALALWAVWAVHEMYQGTTIQPRHWLCAMLFGCTTGFALMIRPIEAMWLIPWVVVAALIAVRFEYRRLLVGRGAMLAVGVGVSVAIWCVGALFAYQTYPVQYGWLPGIGYWMKDQASGAVLQRVAHEGGVRHVLSSLLPFGVHPRAMWRNVNIYLFQYLGVWTGLALLGLYAALRRARTQTAWWIAGCSFWTMIILVLLYGQAQYQDNINQTITLGNSFLRYTLPLVPLLAVGIVFLLDRLWDYGVRGHVFAACAFLLLIGFGVTTAFVRDEEGIMNTRRELQRYVSIRRAAERVMPTGGAIVSERSDKIFASGPFVAMSPLPDAVTWQALAQSGAPIALFHRLLRGDQQEAFFRQMPPVRTQLLLQEGNEALYLLTP
jgi:hypothetical protein